MRTHAATVAITSIWCALLAPACLESPSAIPEADDTGTVPARAIGSDPIGEAAQAAYEDTFHFVVDIKDDGQGVAGGWQIATATLSFIVVDGHHLTPYFFKCPIEIGLPIRSASRGRISPQYAARISAEITTEISESLMHGRDWRGQGAVYCLELYENMEQRFWRPPYDLTGARVKRP